MKIDYKVQRIFKCKKCGNTVVTDTDRLDKRTVFCSRICERRYFRHPPSDNKASMFTYYGKADYDLKE